MMISLWKRIIRKERLGLGSMWSMLNKMEGLLFLSLLFFSILLDRLIRLSNFFLVIFREMEGWREGEIHLCNYY